MVFADDTVICHEVGSSAPGRRGMKVSSSEKNSRVNGGNPGGTVGMWGGEINKVDFQCLRSTVDNDGVCGRKTSKQVGTSKVSAAMWKKRLSKNKRRKEHMSLC